MKYEIREAWLEAAVTELSNLCKQKGGFSVPATRVSLGFPKGGRKRIGEYWHTECATDSRGQIFIHPRLVDPPVVLAVLLHELIHASDNGASGHRGDFVERAKAVGLNKPWTATTAGDDLAQELNELAGELGEFPHASLQPAVKEKKQTTRMIKAQCPSQEHEAPYIIRMSRKQMDEVGTPLCPQHSLSMEADLPEEEEGS